jgi:hypothetical protein
MSDQDIMPRYRMTPPVRGRPPVAPKREALQLTLERAEANGRGAQFAARAFAAAEVECNRAPGSGVRQTLWTLW